jgi:O-antigen ligase
VTFAASIAQSVLRKSADPCSQWGPLLLVFVVATWAVGYFAGFTFSLAVLTAASLLASIVGIFRPGLGLLGISMLCTLDSVTRFYLLSGGLLRWNTINYLLLLLMIVFLPITLRITDIHTRLLAALFLLMMVQLAVTSSLEAGVFAILNVSAAFGLLVCVLRAAGDPTAVVWVAWVNGVLAAAGGVVYYLQYDELPLMNHNAWSQFPLGAIFAVCLAFPYASGRARGQLAILAMISGTWVFLSGSRGGALIGLICMIYLLRNLRGFASKIKVAIVAAAIAGSVLGAFSDFGDRAESRIGKLFDADRSLENRTSGRSDLVRAGWYFFLQHPLGIGTGGFASEFANLHNDDFEGRSVGAHSAWVRTLAENGILGLVLVTMYVLSFAAANGKHRPRELRSLGILVSMILASAFLSREFHSKGLWFVAAVYAAMSSPEYAPFRGERPQKAVLPAGRA